MRYNKKKALADNVNAIETALAVHSQGRQATDSEKKTLVLYSGFGGIKEVLNIGTDKPMPDGMAEPMKRLQEILLGFAKSDTAEYKALIDSIKSSVLTAFYTPQFIIDTVAAQIHAIFKDNGMRMRSFLEPSAGIGGFLKTAMQGTNTYAFEKDIITGLILSLLNDNVTTVTAGFETIGEQDLQDKGFDVIASNIPFGNFRVFDADMWRKGGIYEQSTKTIHNYFFVKSMDLLNEGGILAFVTSRGIADTPGNKFVRDYLVNHADLITALREDAIQEAATKIQEIRSKFNEWLDNQPIEVRDDLVRAYNERFNCYVRPHYDGSAQTFPGLSFEQFPYNDLYPSQKDAIWMIKQNGGGICWHEVGTGKTMIMCVAAYEMKRLGLVRKPVIIGLKANVHEIADTFRKAYPAAKILYPGKEDFTPANRKEVFSKIQNNNWDCIILTHDQFAKIPQSDETMFEIFSEELQDVERSLEVLEESTMRYRSGRMQSGLEKRQQNLQAKLANLRMSINSRKDDTVDFHSMGIDHIFVDESHVMKNLMFQTRHTRVAGIGNTKGSQRAMNLLFAIRDIQKRTGRDLGATFLSGTVVVNALTELYVMFKYMRPAELKRQRISCFDAWAAIFTKKTADYELNVTGAIKRKERFRTYIKVPELAAFLREITDYRTTDMINLDVPEKNVRFLSHAPTMAQEEMIERLVSFAQSGQWEDLGLDIPEPDNLDKAKMLIATNVARKMALDMRLLGDKFHDDESNKASICARTVYDYYARSNVNRGTQFVFSDLSTYKPNEWNIYSDIKEKLVRLGIPADEIQFIQCATTERARKKLFADMNAGRVRVLFGSTSMLGTGVNAQQRAVAVHHLEIPWRPADMEQRNGRAVRKGNTVKLWGNNTVDVVIYGTEKTLDAYKFNLLRNKQMFINQINNGTIAVRRIDEDCMDEDNGMNFAEFVAILSGNTDLLNKAKLDNKIMQLEKELAIFKKERGRAERKIAQNGQDSEKVASAVGRMEDDLEYVASYQGDKVVSLLSIGEDTAEKTGRELHRIAKAYRGNAYTSIGSYMGLDLLVKSEYNLDSSFDRNTFFVEGKSSLKYRYGISGTLPLGFADTARYPQATLAKLPSIIKQQRERMAKLESELPTLQAIVSRTWGRQDELDTLKKGCAELKKRIDESLKENRTKQEKTATETDTTPISGRRATDYAA